MAAQDRGHRVKGAQLDQAALAHLQDDYAPSGGEEPCRSCFWNWTGGDQPPWFLFLQYCIEWIPSIDLELLYFFLMTSEVKL